LLDIEPKLAVERLAREKDRIEQEGLEFFQRVRTGYLMLAEKEPHRFLIMDAQASPESLLKTAQKKIASFLVPQEKEESDKKGREVKEFDPC